MHVQAFLEGKKKENDEQKAEYVEMLRSGASGAGGREQVGILNCTYEFCFGHRRL